MKNKFSIFNKADPARIYTAEAVMLKNSGTKYEYHAKLRGMGPLVTAELRTSVNVRTKSAFDWLLLMY